MAKQAGMSRRTLERRFAEATGLGAGEWLIVVRLEAAKDFLIVSDGLIDEIAKTVGFKGAHAL